MLRRQINLILLTFSVFSSMSAFAQRGGVNGPVDAGALNPASGATSIPTQKLLTVQANCYTQRLYEMLDPFLDLHLRTSVEIFSNNLIEMPKEKIEGSLYSYTEKMRARLEMNLALSTTAYAQELKTAYQTNNFSVNLVTVLDGWDAKTDRPNSIGLFFKKSDNTSSETIFQLGNSNLPVLTYTQQWIGRYSPISKAKVGDYLQANSIQKMWTSDTGNSISLTAPANPEDIIIKNLDGTDSNFHFNGEKFFKCVEAAL